MCCHCELEAAVPAGTLKETRPRAALAHVAASYCNRASVTTGGADPAIRPYHAFQKKRRQCSSFRNAVIMSSTVRILDRVASIVSDITISFGHDQESHERCWPARNSLSLVDKVRVRFRVALVPNPMQKNLAIRVLPHIRQNHENYGGNKMKCGCWTWCENL